MRIRLLVDRTGDRFYQEAGTVLDIPEDEALRMIRASQAEAMGPETACVAPPGEQAVRPAGRPRRRI